MSGSKNGVQKKMRDVAKKALFIHFYAHQLNLVLQHSCNPIRQARDCLDVINSLHEFIESSAKRHSHFGAIQNVDTPIVLKHLSDTRWATRSSSLNAMKATYSSII
jgi:hypothetical protein